MRVDSWVDMAVVGTVARTHGRKGDVVVNLLTDFPEHRFQVGNTFYTLLNERVLDLCVDHIRFQRGRPVIGFKGVNTMDAADVLRGVELRVPESMLRKLPENVYYSHDLVGCRATTVSGEYIGDVVEVQGPERAQRLIVRHGEQEVDIPLAEDICVQIDTASRCVVVAPPEGLLALNRR